MPRPRRGRVSGARSGRDHAPYPAVCPPPPPPPPRRAGRCRAMRGGLLAGVFLVGTALIVPDNGSCTRAAGPLPGSGRGHLSPPGRGAVPDTGGGAACSWCEANSLRRVRRFAGLASCCDATAALQRCRFRHLQAAVDRAGNGDRIAVLPGTYREEPSRAKPTLDPACAPYRCAARSSRRGRSRRP